ncbi:MAG: hypothetical protein SGJ23_07535 [Alphaproteobacteria bacterium]|nr:hypothetical protein [Alphaproteobacteria bacterium]
MLSMEPVVAMPSRDLPFAWAKIDPARQWLALSGAGDDAEVALLVAILAKENDVPDGASIVETVELLGVAEPFTVDGGLRVRHGDFVLEPSCCGVLSDWRGWEGLEPGALTPWMGHDPAPWVATNADAAVIYLDGGAENDRPTTSEHVRVSYVEIAAALAKAVADLEGFQKRLEAWLARHAPGNTTLGPHFRDMFVRLPESA